ncbi:MAG: rod-binding protein [Exilispira sp.]
MELNNISFRNDVKLKSEIYKNNLEIEKLSRFDQNDLKRRQVAEDFASLFTQMLLKELKKSIHEEENPLYGGFKEDVFKDMLYEQYSKILTKEGLKPLVDLIYSSTLRMDGLN